MCSAQWPAVQGSRPGTSPVSVQEEWGWRKHPAALCTARSQSDPVRWRSARGRSAGTLESGAWWERQETKNNAGTLSVAECEIMPSCRLKSLPALSSSAPRAVAPARETDRWSARTRTGTCTLLKTASPTPNPPQWSAATPSPATAHRVRIKPPPN